MSVSNDNAPYVYQTNLIYCYNIISLDVLFFTEEDCVQSKRLVILCN